MSDQSKVYLIGLLGHARAGKDTAFMGFRRKFNGDPAITVEQLAFADGIRSIGYALGIPYKYMRDPNLKQGKYPLFGSDGPTVREILQGIGKGLRTFVSNDIFIKRVGAKVFDIYRIFKNSSCDSSEVADCIIVITDVRMKEEADWIKSIGGCIVRIDNPSLDLSDPMYQHDTEINIDSIEYDKRIVNNFSSAAEAEEMLGDLLHDAWRELPCEMNLDPEVLAHITNIEK